MSTNILEKIGTIGTFVAGVAMPCCFPFLSLIGGIVGLTFLAPYEKYILYTMQALVVLALLGTIIAYRGHRKIAPLILGVLSTAAVVLGEHGYEYSDTLFWPYRTDRRVDLEFYRSKALCRRLQTE